MTGWTGTPAAGQERENRKIGMAFMRGNGVPSFRKTGARKNIQDLARGLFPFRRGSAAFQYRRDYNKRALSPTGGWWRRPGFRKISYAGKSDFGTCRKLNSSKPLPLILGLAVHLLKRLACRAAACHSQNVSDDDFLPVFSSGTSLSKVWPYSTLFGRHGFQDQFSGRAGDFPQAETELPG